MTAVTTDTENLIDRLYAELAKFGISTPYYSIHVAAKMPLEIKKEKLSTELKKELCDFKKSHELKQFERLLKTAIGRLFEDNNPNSYTTFVEPHLWIRIVEDFTDEFSVLVGEYCKPEYLKESERINKIFNKVPDWQLTEGIKKELAGLDIYVFNYQPLRFYIAHPELNQIVKGYIQIEKRTVKDENGKTIWADEGIPEKEEVKTVGLSTPIINAIPVEVTQYDDGQNTETKYKIKFKTKSGKSVTSQINTVEGIVSELKAKNLLADNNMNAEKALGGILTSLEETGKIEVTRNIETSGFYAVDDKIECYGLDLREPTDKDIVECCNFMNELVEKYRRKDPVSNKIINDRRVMPATILKWGIVAPFNYVMKKRYNKFIIWLLLCGNPSTAKTTLAKYALAEWRIHDKNWAVVGFAAANTEARFGKHISQTTLPVVINEVTALSSPKNEALVNVIKNSVDEVTARGTHNRKMAYSTTPALSAMILTGNGAAPDDAGFRTKVQPVLFTTEDVYDREGAEAEEFRKWLNSNVHLLGTVGDIAAKYIMERPQILNDKNWNDIGIEVLGEMYKKTNMEIPDWVYLTMTFKQLEQTTDEIILILRGYFITLINDACNRYRPTADKGEAEDPFLETSKDMEFIDKLRGCCNPKRRLIPFIDYKNRKFYINYEIMVDLKTKKLDNMVSSHVALAKLLGFEHKPVKVNGKPQKLIIATEEQMKGFLEQKIED